MSARTYRTQFRPFSEACCEGGERCPETHRDSLQKEKRLPPQAAPTHLRAQSLDVVLKRGVHPLQGLHRVLVSPQLLGEFLVLVLYAPEDLLGVVVKLVQFVGGGENLCSCVNELQQVSPGFVEPVLPLGNGGSIRMSRVDELIGHVIDRVHTLLPNVPCVSSKFPESFL